MHSILKKLNKRLFLCESSGPSWKNPFSSDYDRQLAEDALYHTIGPLTDNPIWTDHEWNAKLSNNPPVPEFKPNSPAPQWTPEEIVYAMAGDPGLFGKASGNPKSPGYGPAGGSPLFRTAKRIARIYGRDRDKGYVEELYMNGLLELTKKMQPGFDERRSPFIPFVIRSIESAMGHGTGGGREESRASGESSEYFVNELGQIRDRTPSNAEVEQTDDGLLITWKDGRQEKWKKINVVGIKNILKMKDPSELRKAANIIQGEYRTRRAYDKNPGNPFGPFSPAYYQKVNQYADAIESKNRSRIEAAESQLHQLLDEIEDSAIQIRGASSGLGSAISTLDRAKDPKKVAKDTLESMEPSIPCNTCKGTGSVTRGKATETCDSCDGSGLKTETIFDTKVARIGEDEYLYQYLDARGNKAFSRLSAGETADALASRRGINLQSVDVQNKDDEGTAAGNIEGKPEVEIIDPESLEYVLEICMLYDIGDILKNSKKYNALAMSPEFGAKPKKNDPTRADIGGPMTAQELRFIIRRFGSLGQNYPGRGVVRQHTDIPRDGKKGSRNWLEPGEDPEIEPLPTVTEATVSGFKWNYDGGDAKRGDGLWHSWWSSNGYPELGPQEIADEMTMETKKFLKLGIPTARGDRVRQGKPALSKIAAGNTAKSAKIKLQIIADIHKDQVRNDFEESVLRRLPIVEEAQSLDQIDRKAVVATCEAIIRKLDEAIAILDEDSPPGWKGTVKAMKPHSVLIEGIPKKKKKYANEGMQPVDAISEVDE